jgi:aminoglycoside/choline kinase family phosphotransferase
MSVERRANTAIEQFLATTDAAGCSREILAGDASARRYERLTHVENGTTWVLMIAPPKARKDINAFGAIARYLRSSALSAPIIKAGDPDNGLLLLEDFGDASFASLLRAQPTKEPALYGAATDLLVHLHAAPPPENVPNYLVSDMARKSEIVFEWYVSQVSGQIKQSLTLQFRREITRLLQTIMATRPMLALRDYHSDNLMWLPARDDIRRVGLLDFQDAVMTHPAYDLASLLQDARRDVDPAIQQAMITRYIQSTGHDAAEFLAAYAMCGLQRNIRIMGVFTRLAIAYDKPGYLDFLPRVWGHILDDLEHPMLHDLRELILNNFPPPDPQIIESLRSTCRQNHIR